MKAKFKEETLRIYKERPDNFITMKQKNLYLLMMILTAQTFGVTACSTLSAPTGHKIKLTQDVYVTDTRGAQEKKSKEEVIEVSNEPVLVEAPGYIGVVILPPGKQSAETTLQLKPVTDWSGTVFERRADLVVSQLLEKIYEVQLSLAKGQSQHALELTKQLREKFPNVGYLKFIEASCLVVLGQRAPAKALLEEALKTYPDNEDAKKLYSTITTEKGG